MDSAGQIQKVKSTESPFPAQGFTVLKENIFNAKKQEGPIEHCPEENVPLQHSPLLSSVMYLALITCKTVARKLCIWCLESWV
jgi:hypothetical protein